MTDEELKEIEERAAKATRGPWARTYDGSSSWSIGPAPDPQAQPVAVALTRGQEDEEANPAFISNARTDVPALIAEVRRLRVVATRVAMRVNSEASYDEKGCLEKWREKRSLNLEEILIEIDADTP